MDGIEAKWRRVGSRPSPASGFVGSGRRDKRRIVREAREARCSEARGRAAPRCSRERIEPMAHGTAQRSIRGEEGGQHGAIVAGEGSQSADIASGESAGCAPRSQRAPRLSHRSGVSRRAAFNGTGGGGRRAIAHGAAGVIAVLMGLPSGSRIWLAAGFTDLRKGMDGLSALVQTALQESPYSGHIFVFRGRRGDKIKILWHSGDGVCLFLQTLERGQIRVASGAERRGVDERGATIDVARGDRLATTEEKCAGAAGSGSSASDACRVERRQVQVSVVI